MHDLDDTSLHSDLERRPAIFAWGVWVDISLEEQVISHLNVAGTACSMQAVEALGAHYVEVEV